MKIEFDFNRKKKHSILGENKLQVDIIKRKIEAKFNNSLFIQISNTFKRQKDHKLSSNQIDTIR